MQLTTIPCETTGKERTIYKCDGSCSDIFLRRDLLTVPTAEGNWICDKCAETHFNIPITDGDNIAVPLAEMDSKDIPDIIHNNNEMLEEVKQINYKSDTQTIVGAER